MKVEASVNRGPESWQFFAFDFAALISIGLSFLDEMPACHTFRLTAKVVYSIFCGYFCLINPRSRNWLAGLLGKFKQEGH